MSTYFLQSLLPDWLEYNETGVTVLPPFDFQLRWETKISLLWDALTDSERENITPIEPPYTEEIVAEFVHRLKTTKNNTNYCFSCFSVECYYLVST